jgi:hypothetical protein
VLFLCLASTSVSQDEGQREDKYKALWLSIKSQLTAPEGEKYFDESVMDTLLPPLRGHLVSSVLRDGESKLVLGLSDPDTPEVTLIVRHRRTEVKQPPTEGSIIEFSGVGSEFSKEPFMLTLLVRPSDIVGLEFRQKN